MNKVWATRLSACSNSSPGQLTSQTSSPDEAGIDYLSRNYLNGSRREEWGEIKSFLVSSGWVSRVRTLQSIHSGCKAVFERVGSKISVKSEISFISTLFCMWNVWCCSKFTENLPCVLNLSGSSRELFSHNGLVCDIYVGVLWLHIINSI